MVISGCIGDCCYRLGKRGRRQVALLYRSSNTIRMIVGVSIVEATDAEQDQQDYPTPNSEEA
jgi:hypothetical protein